MPHVLSSRSLEFAQTLVRMDTASERGNLELIDFVRDHLAGLGVRSRITRSTDRSRANLFATLGAGKPAGVILAGHTDTVGWDGQAWSVDPLSAMVQSWPTGTQDEGGEALYHAPRLCGRGAADMKGFIALAVANATRFLEGDAPFAVHLALSPDVETGGFGVRELIADMRQARVQPLACIVGAPTGMVPALAHKGLYRFRCQVRGRAVHGALAPQSVNAVEMAAQLIGRLRDMNEAFAAQAPRLSGFEPPSSTVSVGAFHSSGSASLLPGQAEFSYEFRNLPSDDAAAMQQAVLRQAGLLAPAMQAIAPEAGFHFEPLCAVPGFRGAPDDGLTQLAQRLAGTDQLTQLAFSTAAGLFQQAGIPTVVCGPGHIQQAHRPDEYVSLAQLAQCEQFLQGLAVAPRIA